MLKKNKRKINVTIDLCFYAYMLIVIIWKFAFVTDWSELLKEASYIESAHISYIFISILFLFVFTIVSAIFKNIFVIVIYVGIKLGIKNAKKDRLTNLDLKKHEGYYRDIIKEHSPALLSFIDDYKASENKDIVATLLNLKLKKYIDITENNIVILDKSQNNLDENEKYVLDNYNNCNITVFNSFVAKDAVNSGLIVTKDIIRDKIKKRAKTQIIGLLIFIFSFIIMQSNIHLINNPVILISSTIIFIFAVSSLFLYPFFSMMYFISYTVTHAAMPYIRTKKGNEIKEMLEGLRNYIKDFSLLEEKGKDELILWDEYLIYSVIFDQNKKIIKEFEEIIK